MRAGITSLDLGGASGVGPGTVPVLPAQVHVGRHVVLMLLVLVASEAVHVSRHGRREGRQEGHGEKTSENALHCP